MITEIEKKIGMETKEQQSVKEAGQQDPAQQRCQGRGGGLEEKAMSPVRAAADFTHEKARKRCFHNAETQDAKEKSMQIIFFWHSADDKK